VIPQDTTTNYHFEVRMNLENVGSTPANNVRSFARSAILPFPLPDDFKLPALDQEAPTNFIGPHQSFLLTGYADQIYSDEEVEELKTGAKKRLYVYGSVTYEDAFGETRHTNFCQTVVPLKNNQFMSLTDARYSQAD
jgi:hypothetical protein